MSYFLNIKNETQCIAKKIKFQIEETCFVNIMHPTKWYGNINLDQNHTAQKKQTFRAQSQFNTNSNCAPVTSMFKHCRMRYKNSTMTHPLFPKPSSSIPTSPFPLWSRKMPLFSLPGQHSKRIPLLACRFGEIGV